MNKNVELKDEITLDEYKAWLTGMLHGKGTKLPDLNDWKAIKKMTDKIVPDVVETTPWTIAPYVAPVTIPDPVTIPFWWENQPMCGSGEINGDNITIANGTSSISIGDNGVTIGYSNSECGGAYGCPPEPATQAMKKSLQDYTWDTSKYVIPEEAELAPITELSTAEKMRIVIMDKKREK